MERARAPFEPAAALCGFAAWPSAATCDGRGRGAALAALGEPARSAVVPESYSAHAITIRVSRGQSLATYRPYRERAANRGQARILPLQ